jgi:hypothetical protein
MSEIKSNIEKTLDAAERLNPELNSFLSVERDYAMNRVEELEKEADEKPLRGFAIAVKDNICTKGLQTTCGSRILGNYQAQYDATAVRKLNEGGAIIVGKANMDEFAMVRRMKIQRSARRAIRGTRRMFPAEVRAARRSPSLRASCAHLSVRKPADRFASRLRFAASSDSSRLTAESRGSVWWRSLRRSIKSEFSGEQQKMRLKF